MAEKTAIGWTDATFNPWWGCEAVSPGCEHCYAEAMVKRLGRNFAERERTSDANWQEPIRWNKKAERAGKPTRVFCASMADVFDNQVPEAWRVDLFNLIEATPWLQWQLLTKRIGNAAAYRLPDNVHVGITVVNREEVRRDVAKLLDLPVRVRFLSCEPMLEPLDLRGPLATGALHWVICGGESGHAARPFNLDWARELRNQCAAAGVAFFMKQMGRHPRAGWENVVRYTDRAGADPAEWPIDLRVQEFPQ